MEEGNMTDDESRAKGVRNTTKRQAQSESAKEPLSLYPLAIEDAVRAALKTGRAPALKPNRTNRQRKKRTKPGLS
jgi:hypothetical protein